MRIFLPKIDQAPPPPDESSSDMAATIAALQQQMLAQQAELAIRTLARDVEGEDAIHCVLVPEA